MKAGLFPGQGIERNVVLDSLPDDHPRLRDARRLLGYDLRRALERTTDHLPTRLAQPAILTSGVIAYETATTSGASFDYLLGHSLGEYTALVAAGAISFAQGLRLVATRGQLMERASARSTGGMVAVLRLEAAHAEAIATDCEIAVANDNTPTQIVLSGNDDGLARAARAVARAGGRTIRLAVDGAFHTAAMDPAIPELDEALVHVIVKSPQVPVVSNVSARPFRAPGEIRRLLLEQLTHRVRFRESVEWLAERGVTDFVDLGPGSVVQGLVRATLQPRVVAHA